MSHVLVVEDEERIASFLRKGLSSNGYATTVVAEGGQALAHVRTGDVDLVILDLGLPDRDGLDVLRDLRSIEPDLPVIILTARDSVVDTVAGLDRGADDYMVKPFRFEELLARVRARLRPRGAASTTEIEVGGLVLDVPARHVRKADREIELTAREFALAQAFFRHPGQVLTREQLLDQVWGLDHDPESNVVDVYVGYLRKKLGDDRITTVRGMGYRLEKRPRSDR